MALRAPSPVSPVPRVLGQDAQPCETVGFGVPVVVKRCETM